MLAKSPRAGRLTMGNPDLAVVAISFARLDGVLTPGINVHGFAGATPLRLS